MMPQQRIVVTVFALTAAAALVVSGVLLERRILRPSERSLPQGEMIQRPAGERVANLNALRAGPHRLGSQDAPVTLVVFADFECPACRVFEMGALAGVRSSQGGEVAIVFRHFTTPYHRYAIPTAIGAECSARQSKFWEFHDVVFERQAELSALPVDSFAAASQVPDMAAFRDCLTDPRAAEAVQSDLRIAQELGAWATPFIVLYGEILGFVPDSAELSSLIQRIP